jgi:hypothetical protein
MVIKTSFMSSFTIIVIPRQGTDYSQNKSWSKTTKNKSKRSIPHGSLNGPVKSPDFIPDPGIFQTLGSQFSLKFLQLGSVIANTVNFVVGNYDLGAMTAAQPI